MPVFILRPQVFLGGLVVIMIGVLNVASPARGRMSSGPVVPRAVRASFAWFFEPVGLLLTQMVGFLGN